MTPAEVALWQLLRGGELGVRFQRQMAIGPFIADFVCRKRKLIVELDGADHFEVWDDADLRRDAYLRNRGYRMLRFENDEVADNPGLVLAAIKAHLDR